MRGRTSAAGAAALLLLIGGAGRAGADADNEEKASGAASASALALTAAQQEAVGLHLAHPMPARGAREIQAYGVVLDPVELVTGLGRVASSRSAARNAFADARRVAGLYHNEANASLKALQAAEAAQVEAEAQAQAAAISFGLQWGPIAALSEEERAALILAIRGGKSILVRADVPGRHLLGALPSRALLTVDGIGIPARLLGALPRTAPDLQSAGWLLEVEHAPTGLGPGAHVQVSLQGAALAGLLVPSSALLYGDAGAYVYRQSGARSRDGKTPFAPAPVKLLEPQGEGWLVQGLAGADSIVVHGAGVLWSLQGLGSFSAAEEEHD